MELPQAERWDLNGKTAVITGAASGFGRELALLCKAAGMRLVLLGANTCIDEPHPRSRGGTRAGIGVEHRLRDFMAGGAPNNPLEGV